MTIRTTNGNHTPRQHVHIQSDSATHYWATHLGCSDAELRAAVFAVGTPVEMVREHLRLKRRRAPQVSRCRRGSSMG